MKHTYASRLLSTEDVISTNFWLIGEYLTTAKLTGEPAVASSISEPHAPLPPPAVESQKRIFGELMVLPPVLER
jgi:hypothetical protein